MTISCPKCASSDGRSVEAIYCECAGNERHSMSKRPILSRQATPPEPRHPLPWLAASLVFAIIAIAFARSDLSAAAALTVCAVLSGLMTYDAQRYNRADLPRLVEYWHRAFMCNRCGEVFVPA